MQLRLATPHDAAAVQDIYAPYVETTPISFETEVPSVDEIAHRIESKQPRHPWLLAVDEAGGTAGGEGAPVLGYAYAGRFAPRSAYDWSCEASVYVSDAARGRGVGRALYAALLPLLTAQGYREVMAGIALPNDASVGIHEAFGFRPVGVFPRAGWKFGAWHDVGWWQLTLPAHDPPVPPVPIDQLAPEVLGRVLGG